MVQAVGLFYLLNITCVVYFCKSDDSPAICVAPTELGAVDDRKTFTIAVTSAEMEALPVAPPLNVKGLD